MCLSAHYRQVFVDIKYKASSTRKRRRHISRAVTVVPLDYSHSSSEVTTLQIVMQLRHLLTYSDHHGRVRTMNDALEKLSVEINDYLWCLLSDIV